MKKIVSVLLVFISFLLLGCEKEQSNRIEVNIDLDIYETVSEGNYIGFEYSETVNINSFYEIINIEQLTTGFGEFPYESVFINENEFSKYIRGIDIYVDQINDKAISQSTLSMLIPKPKLIITLSNGNSDIILNFYQNSSNVINASSIEYHDYQNISFIHYFQDDDTLEYLEINNLI